MIKSHLNSVAAVPVAPPREFRGIVLVPLTISAETPYHNGRTTGREGLVGHRGCTPRHCRLRRLCLQKWERGERWWFIIALREGISVTRKEWGVERYALTSDCRAKIHRCNTWKSEITSLSVKFKSHRITLYTLPAPFDSKFQYPHKTDRCRYIILGQRPFPSFISQDLERQSAGYR